MINITKKEHETSSAFIRRFTQRVQSSSTLRQAKRRKFFSKDINRNMRRDAAVARSKKTKEYKKLWKLGKIK